MNKDSTGILSVLPKTPLVSIVITSYTINRLKGLCELLDSLTKQSYKNIEVIIVIEKSKELYDKLKEYVNNACKDYLSNNLKLIFSKDELGISAARNLGARHAKGDIVAFVDDDAILFPDWTENIVKAFSLSGEIVGVTGPALPLWEDKSLSWFPKEFFWMVGCNEWKGLNSTCEVEYAWGVNMAFRRFVFNRVYFRNLYTKGAHQEGKIGPVGDDRHFSLEAKRATNGKIIYNPYMKVWHKVDAYKLTSKYIRRYSFWQGYSDAMFKYVLKASHERFKSEYSVLLLIISNLLPSIMREFIRGRQIAFKKLRVLMEVVVYFSIGYISFLIPGLIYVTKKLV